MAIVPQGSCPIWPDHSAPSSALRGESGGPRAASFFHCPTCGDFEMSDTAAVSVRSMDELQRWRLSWATRNASDHEAPLRLLSADLEPTVESVAEPSTPLGKIDILVRLIGSRTRALGALVTFSATTDWPQIYACGPEEAKHLVMGLAQLGYASIASDGASLLIGGRLSLTLKGWERLAEISKDARPPSIRAFVAMWFDPSMKPSYDDGFQPALYDLGYDPIRVDREEYLGKIDDFIIASIRESALLVADFTGHRGGVYYEAGFAKGLGIPVVFTCREDQIGEAHFDTRQYNHITWTTPADLAERLRARIEATIPNRPRRRS